MNFMNFTNFMDFMNSLLAKILIFLNIYLKRGVIIYNFVFYLMFFTAIVSKGWFQWRYLSCADPGIMGII